MTASGSLALTDALRGWWRRWRQEHPPRPFIVCVDPVHEIACERLTAEEYAAHTLEQTRISKHILDRRCAGSLDKRCV